MSHGGTGEFPTNQFAQEPGMMPIVEVWGGDRGKTLMSLSQAPGPLGGDSGRQPAGNVRGRNGGN